MVKEYTAEQREGFSKGYDYWAVFTSDKGSLSRFYALYKVNGSVPKTPDLMPENWPIPESFQGEGEYFNLEKLDILEQYEGRLIIDWGKATRMWHQKGTTEKPVVAIQAETKRHFPGYQNVVLTFDQLEEVIQNSIEYGRSGGIRTRGLLVSRRIMKMAGRIVLYPLLSDSLLDKAG